MGNVIYPSPSDPNMTPDSHSSLPLPGGENGSTVNICGNAVSDNSMANKSGSVISEGINPFKQMSILNLMQLNGR